jgi:hypothetical protein
MVGIRAPASKRARPQGTRAGIAETRAAEIAETVGAMTSSGTSIRRLCDPHAGAFEPRKEP